MEAGLHIHILFPYHLCFYVMYTKTMQKNRKYAAHLQLLVDTLAYIIIEQGQSDMISRHTQETQMHLANK